MKRSPGVTLIELCVVCAVIAAVAMISWPAVNRYAAASRLEMAGDKLAATLAFARDSAVLEGRNYRVSFNAVDGTYDVLNQNDPVNDPETYSPVRNSVVRKQRIPGGLVISAISGRELNFTPDGTSEDFYVRIRNTSGSELGLYVTGISGKCLVRKS